MVKTKITETTEKYDENGNMVEKTIREEITEDDTNYTLDKGLIGQGENWWENQPTVKYLNNTNNR